MTRKLVLQTSTVAMVAIMLVAAVADAQQGRGRGPRGGFGGGGFGFGRGGGGLDLLSLTRIEKVQQELEMLEDQVAEIDKLLEEQQAARRGGGRGRGPGGPRGDGEGRGDRGGRPGGGRPGGDLSDEERQARFAEFQRQREERAKQNEEKLAAILLPHQLDRLKEIHLQTRGTAALRDADVAGKLGITDEQKTQLSAVADEMQNEMRAAFQSLRDSGGGFEGMREKMTEMRTKSDEKALAVLNDEQKKAFAEMKGEPFEMPRPNFGGFGGRGRGGPGGPGGGRPGRPGRPERPERPARPEA